MNRFQFVADHQSRYGVKRRCTILGIARSSFYYWRRTAADRAARLVADARLTTRLRSGSHTDNALAEPFNTTFRHETLQDRKHCSSEREAPLDAFRRLNRCDTRRRHSRLGQRSPTAYETALDTTATTLAQAA